MRTVETPVYQFDELSDAAKERARDWYRGVSDDGWYDAIYEDAETCAKILGIDLRQRPFQTVGGKTRYEPAIYFGNMYCQGGGACFEGSYSYAKGCSRAIRRHAPPSYKNRITGEIETSESNARLARIADGLVEVQKKYGYKVTASVKQSGHYYHEYSTDIEVSRETSNGDDSIEQEDEKKLIELLREFMRWIFQQLVDEDQYLNSNEAVDESITANEYEFTENGERF